MTARPRLSINPEVWKQWLSDVQEQGPGFYSFGSKHADRHEPGHLWIHFETLVPANLYVSPENQEAPPIRFDRTSDDEIILPGRWWQDWIALVAQSGLNPPPRIQRFARTLSSGDTVAAVVPAGPELGRTTSAETILAE